MPAAAVTLSRADAGTFVRYEHGGEQVIGVMAKDSTNNYYCIESGERVEYQLGESVKLRDDDTARRLGWLMGRMIIATGRPRSMRRSRCWPMICWA